MGNEQITEIAEFEVDRIDAVGKAVNGFPVLLLKMAATEVEEVAKAAGGSRKTEEVDGAAAKAEIDRFETFAKGCKSAGRWEDFEFVHVPPALAEGLNAAGAAGLPTTAAIAARLRLS